MPFLRMPADGTHAEEEVGLMPPTFNPSLAGPNPLTASQRAAADTPPRAVLSRAASLFLVAVAYYGGGQIDQLLGWTSSPAILWPPNAVLLATLLLAPQRTWWM